MSGESRSGANALCSSSLLKKMEEFYIWLKANLQNCLRFINHEGFAKLLGDCVMAGILWLFLKSFVSSVFYLIAVASLLPVVCKLSYDCCEYLRCLYDTITGANPDNSKRPLEYVKLLAQVALVAGIIGMIYTVGTPVMNLLSPILCFALVRLAQCVQKKGYQYMNNFNGQLDKFINFFAHLFPTVPVRESGAHPVCG